MSPVNGKGFAAGAVAWLACMLIATWKASCAEYKGCGAGDLMISSILSAGMVLPAWMLASFVSGIFPGKEED